MMIHYNKYLLFKASKIEGNLLQRKRENEISHNEFN